MNLRFDRINIENFRSIQHADVVLSNQGTVIVKGVNEYEEKATSNGSGKSSIFEALIFALFEETSSGEKDVANRIIDDGYTVTLYFSVDNTDYVITRYQRGGKSNVTIHKGDIDISAKNKTDTNKLILSILGISKSIFLDSVFLSQNANTNLASLSPTARKERLEVLTNTDYTISKFKEDLKAKQNEYETKCVSAQMELNKLSGNIDALKRQRSELEFKINALQQEKERVFQYGNVEDICNLIENNEKLISGCDEEIQNIDNQINQHEAQVAETRVKLEQQQKQKDELDKELNGFTTEWNRLDAEIGKYKIDIHYQQQNINKLLEDIEAIRTSDTCPTCGRKYENSNEQHINQLIEAYNEDIAEKNRIIAEYNTKIEEVENKKTTTNDLITGVKDKLNVLVQEMTAIKSEVGNSDRVKMELQAKRKLEVDKQNGYRQTISTLQARKEELIKYSFDTIKEFEDMIQQINTDITDIEDLINKQQEEYTVNNNYVEVIKNSTQLVTKEFRTYLLQNSLNYLNKLLQIYSVKLFSNDQDVIQINGDDAKLDIKLGTASYESLSGGERTRVNIALLLAQKSLANAIGNISCNIIILDEILGYCDSQAESNVIDLITKELDSLESIYMVSHKEIPVGYDTQLVVVKDKTGLSRVVDY